MNIKSKKILAFSTMRKKSHAHMFLLKVLFQLFVQSLHCVIQLKDTEHKQVLRDDFPSQGKSMYRLVTVICGLRGVGLAHCCLNGVGVTPSLTTIPKASECISVLAVAWVCQSLYIVRIPSPYKGKNCPLRGMT